MMSHSNGGLVIQVAQQKLVNSGTNFLQEHGIDKITFMAPVPSAPVVWPDQEAIRDALIFQQFCLALGPFMPPSPCEILDVLPPVDEITWADLQAIDPLNVMYDCNPLTVPIGVPTIMAVPLNCEDPPLNPLGDHTPIGTLGGPAPEALMIVREIFGIPPQQRSVTQEDIFKGTQNGTLSIIAFQEDLVVGPPSVLENLFNHLTDPSKTDKFQVVGGPNSNHVMFFVAPEEMLQAVAGNICFIPIVSSIPTLSEWGLIAMAGVLGIVGFMVLRRRKVTA